MNNDTARDLHEEEQAASVEDTARPTQQAGADAEGEETGEGDRRDLAAEYLDALQRERASFLNYKRRVAAEHEEAAYRATSNLLKKLLPVVDDFDRAVAHIPQEAKSTPWVEGVTAIARKLHGVLESEDIEQIESLGKAFDPNLHEAVAFDDGEGGEDVVSEVYAQGYKKGDRVIRPAMVKVARG